MGGFGFGIAFGFGRGIALTSISSHLPSSFGIHAVFGADFRGSCECRRLLGWWLLHWQWEKPFRESWRRHISHRLSCPALLIWDPRPRWRSVIDWRVGSRPLLDERRHILRRRFHRQGTWRRGLDWRNRWLRCWLRRRLWWWCLWLRRLVCGVWWATSCLRSGPPRVWWATSCFWVLWWATSC